MHAARARRTSTLNLGHVFYLHLDADYFFGLLHGRVHCVGRAFQEGEERPQAYLLSRPLAPQVSQARFAQGARQQGGPRL